MSDVVDTPEVSESAEPSIQDAAAVAVESIDGNPPPEKINLEQVAKDMKRKFKLKVDGKEEEAEFDLDNNEELAKQFQLARVAQKRMSEYSSLKKDVDELAKLLLSSPETVLESLGMDVDKMAEKRLSRKIDELQKSPEQRAKEELERKVKDYEQKLSRIENEKRGESELRLQHEEANKINTQIEQALTKYPDLPRTPYTLERLSRYMIAEMDNGNDAVTVEDALARVKRDSDSEVKQRFQKLSESDKFEMIEELVGKDILEKMRKRRLTQNKQAVATPSSIKTTGETELRQTEAKAKSKIPIRDFLKGLGNK